MIMWADGNFARVASISAMLCLSHVSIVSLAVLFVHACRMTHLTVAVLPWKSVISFWTSGMLAPLLAKFYLSCFTPIEVAWFYPSTHRVAKDDDVRI